VRPHPACAACVYRSLLQGRAGLGALEPSCPVLPLANGRITGSDLRVGRSTTAVGKTQRGALREVFRACGEQPRAGCGCWRVATPWAGLCRATTWGIPSVQKSSRAGRSWCDGVLLWAARQGSSSISPSAPAGGHRGALSGVLANGSRRGAGLGVTMVQPSPNGTGYMGL
jgi:hypothetical protein